jgi:hypothetical protein
MKNNSQYNYLTNHQELSRLLPWYANKTLRGAELQAVESHLSACLICKRELISLQKLAQAIVHDSSLDSVEQAAFSRLKSRIHSGQSHDALAETCANKSQPHDAARNLTSIHAAPKRNRFGFNMPRPALALAAGILISLLIPRYLETGLSQSADFRTLSSSQHEQQSIRPNDIRVVFAENVSPQQRSSIVESIRGELIDAPTAQGVYTVRLDRETGAKRLIQIVDLLRQDAHVVFAEPSYALLSSERTEE